MVDLETELNSQVVSTLVRPIRTRSVKRKRIKNHLKSGRRVVNVETQYCAHKSNDTVHRRIHSISPIPSFDIIEGNIAQSCGCATQTSHRYTDCTMYRKEHLQGGNTGTETHRMNTLPGQTDRQTGEYPGQTDRQVGEEHSSIKMWPGQTDNQTGEGDGYAHSGLCTPQGGEYDWWNSCWSPDPDI